MQSAENFISIEADELLELLKKNDLEVVLNRRKVLRRMLSDLVYGEGYKFLVENQLSFNYPIYVRRKFGDYPMMMKYLSFPRKSLNLLADKYLDYMNKIKKSN